VKAAPAARRPATAPAAGRPRFFATAAAFRAWLGRHHGTESVLLVGFHRVATGKGTLTYPQALDQALCFGWIDGLRRGLDADSYSIRFTPRRPGSIWSQVNLRHVERLEREGRMAAAGRAVFAARDPKRTLLYSFEVRRNLLDGRFAKRLAADAKASAHFEAMPPSYQRPALHWIMSAKQEATRERRFATLLECSRRGVKVPPLDYPRPAAKTAVPAPKSAAKAAVPPRRPARGRRIAARGKPSPRKA
jgi:uncharacterized protein YdeI (YjbR/CyaY-like superfamily)